MVMRGRRTEAGQAGRPDVGWMYRVGPNWKRAVSCDALRRPVIESVTKQEQWQKLLGYVLGNQAS